MRIIAFPKDGGESWLLKVCFDDVGDGVVLVDYDHIPPLVKSSAGVRDSEGD